LKVSLFGVGLQGKTPDVSAQRRLNLYLGVPPGRGRRSHRGARTPGLTLFYDFGDTPGRGVHALGDFLYVVHRGTFWEVNNAGVATNRGSLLTTTGRVYFADNGTTIMLVDGQYGYTYNTSTTTPIAQIVDVDYVPRTR
jgi:hypothetical protein